jgi:hypothetical protein
MVQAVAALIDFCYLVRRSVIDEDALTQIQAALTRFHQYREIFRELGVRSDGFSLPRQHSLIHYPFLITQFGAPNGLCSSITESKHIKAVKKPYRRSSRNNPLGQMLVTNQRLDKIAAARINFTSRGMLSGPNLSSGFLAQLSISVDNDIPQPALDNIKQTVPAILPGNNNDGEGDAGAVDEPDSLAEVTLAKTYGKSVTNSNTIRYTNFFSLF